MENGNLWTNMEALRREINRAFSPDARRQMPLFRTAFLPGRAARQYPLINLNEDPDTLYVEALAPGVDPTSLELAVMGNTLTISGEKRRLPEDIKPDAFHRSERAAGRFRRLIELPLEVAPNNVKADYNNGILLVTLPKAEQAKPKQITVQVD